MVLGGGSLGGEGRLDALGVGHLQSAIDLVRRDVIETLALVLLRQGLPVEFRRLEHGEGAHDVGLGESEGVLDGAVHVALCRQMDDAGDVLLLHEGVDGIKIADVCAHKPIVRLVLDVLEVREVACVGQFVHVDDPVVRVFVDEEPYYMASDKSGSAGDDDGLHIFQIYGFL